MTVSSTTPLRVQYNGNGATTAFSVTFPFTKALANSSNIEVIITTVATGVEVTKTEVTHYTVTGGSLTGSPATGTVTFLVAPATGERVTIHGTEPNTQGLDLIEGGDQPSGLIEREFDSLTLQVQGLQEQLTRAIVFSVGSTTTDISVQTPVVDSVLYWSDATTIGSLSQDTISAPISLSSVGMLACTSLTSPRTYAGRTLTGTAAEITVTNGDGVSGNPTLSLPTALTFTGKTVTGGTFTGITDIAVADGGTGASNAGDARTNLGLAIGTNVEAHDATLTALAAYNTAGILTQTAADTFTGRTIAGSNGVAVTNGNGVAGNPTLNLDITGLTVDGSPDTAADYLATYDASASTNKKVLLSTLVSLPANYGLVLAIANSQFTN